VIHVVNLLTEQGGISYRWLSGFYYGINKDLCGYL